NASKFGGAAGRRWACATPVDTAMTRASTAVTRCGHEFVIVERNSTARRGSRAPQFFHPGSHLPGILARRTVSGRRRERHYSAVPTAALYYSRNRKLANMPREERKGYGHARVRHEPVPGRLRRPPSVCAKPHALPPLHRGGSGAGGQRVRSPHV